MGIFSDNCKQLFDGTFDRGPSILIMLCMLSTVSGILFDIKNRIDKGGGLSMNDYIKIIVSCIISFINLYIFYKMSYRCNDKTAILIVFILSLFIWRPLRLLMKDK